MFRLTSRLRFIEPQLASPVDQPPVGKHWIHEIKHDGYRSQVVIERGQVRVFSRNGHDWSDPILALLAHSDGLSYAGAAFIALAGEEWAKFFAELERLTTSWGLFKASRMTDVKWCHPRLAVEVKHLAGSKTLRHATVITDCGVGELTLWQGDS
jgi:ATP-dependent DNA ligase